MSIEVNSGESQLMSFRSSERVRPCDQQGETGSIPGSSTIKGPGQGDNREPGPFCVNTYVNKPGYDQRAMASLRTRTRKESTAYHAVLYRHDGRQTSTSFEDLATAMTFRDLVDVVGPAPTRGWQTLLVLNTRPGRRSPAPTGNPTAASHVVQNRYVMRVQ